MLEVRFLGQFDVRWNGTSLAISTRHAQELFAYLVLHAGKRQRRERLAGILWPDSSEENARSNLRHELWRLRKALGKGREDLILVDDLTIAFQPPQNYSCDVHRLESLPLAGVSAEESSEALLSYHGELLPGFYADWIFLERERLSGLYEARINRLLEILQKEERWEEVIEWANRWIAFGKLPEPAYRALLSAYANSGDLSKAAATYEHYALALQKEVGVNPSEQTQSLYKRIKAGWKPDDQKAPPSLGPQPPKLVIEHAPHLAPLPMVKRSNLPKPLTSFIGREKEIQQVERLVSRNRLVTITGSGGVGKTRLAIQAAEALADRFRDGVWWVELASLFASTSQGTPDAFGNRAARDQATGQGGILGEDLVLQAAAKVLRVFELPDQTPLEAVLEHLRDRQLLLVLDNCEHLIDACAALAERLLGHCPEVTILATSREALGISGEKAWNLPSLSLPEIGRSAEVENIFQSEAASLFFSRAADVLPGYQPRAAEVAAIVQICLRLDGIPLAIELAAARMSLLSAQEIAGRLDQRFSLLTGGRRTALPRHQTLLGAIEWSHDLLSETERVLFRRLSVFAGSFTLKAAEAICTGGEVRQEQVLTLLGRLVDKSLLNVEPAPQDSDIATCYRFLDTIRTFGRLKLDVAGETRTMRDRHAAYYVRLAEAAAPELLFRDQVQWRKLLQAKQDNLRAVFEWSTESDQAESALRLAAALLWFWFGEGSNREGRDLALKAVSLPSAAQFKELRARALTTLGFMQCLLGDTAHARHSIEDAVTIIRELGDQAGLAWSLQFLGFVFAYDQEYEQAEAAFREGKVLSRALMGGAQNNILFILGDVDLQRGDRLRAKKTYEESAELFRSIGNRSFLAYPLRRLGYLALEQNDIPLARDYFQESLYLNHETGDKPGLTASLLSMAALALQEDRPVLAARLYGVVESRLESLSVNLLFPDRIELLEISGLLLTHLGPPALTAAISEGWALTEEQAIEMVAEILAESA